MAPVEIRGLSKRFGDVEAVRDLSFEVAPGRVTGFLGPNGAGKSTTLRALLGLIRPTSGTATFAGRTYGELEHPASHVGAVLEETSFHPGRTARNHLRVLATAAGHPLERCETVLETVGLTEFADRRVKGYSLGMRQRLAIAAALLGDPEVLILDEPANGLDPPGINAMRTMLRLQAEAGRAVLISSHLLAEVAQSVDDVVVIARGELRAAGTLADVLGGPGSAAPTAEVRTLDPRGLSAALTRHGHGVRHEGDVLVVTATTEQVGVVAAEERIVLTGLAARGRSLETAFLALTGDAR